MARITKQDETPKQVNEQPAYFTGHRPWLMPALLGLIAVFLLALLMQGWSGPGRFEHNFRDDDLSMMSRRHTGMMGTSRFSTGQNSIRGVVTAVNGSTFTIAGGGATNDIDTNSSTQYQNGNQVKVNDSVVVFGSTSSGKFTATQVVINP